MARTVVLEVEWVLRGVYRMAVERVIPALRAVAGMPGVTVEDATIVAKALDWGEAGMDFADALHLAAAGICKRFVTFDKGLLKAGARVMNIPIVAPSPQPT